MLLEFERMRREVVARRDKVEDDLAEAQEDGDIEEECRLEGALAELTWVFGLFPR